MLLMLPRMGVRDMDCFWCFGFLVSIEGLCRLCHFLSGDWSDIPPACP